MPDFGSSGSSSTRANIGSGALWRTGRRFVAVALPRAAIASLTALATLAILLPGGARAQTSMIDDCRYPDDASARALWKPMQGSPEVSIAQPDGQPALHLRCAFQGTNIARGAPCMKNVCRLTDKPTADFASYQAPSGSVEPSAAEPVDLAQSEPATAASPARSAPAAVAHSHPAAPPDSSAEHSAPLPAVCRGSPHGNRMKALIQPLFASPIRMPSSHPGF